SSMPIWSLHHYEHGKPVGGSIARGDQVQEWLADLERAGYVIGLGWELRGEMAPDDWPGWPADEDDEREPCGENHCLCYCIGDCHACGCDCPREPDGQVSKL